VRSRTVQKGFSQGPGGGPDAGKDLANNQLLRQDRLPRLGRATIPAICCQAGCLKYKPGCPGPELFDWDLPASRRPED